MAYAHTNSKGDTYYLHARDVTLRSGKHQKIYYFAKQVQTGALHVLPSGKIVVENEKTGLPILKTKEDTPAVGTAEVLNGEMIKIKGKKEEAVKEEVKEAAVEQTEKEKPVQEAVLTESMEEPEMSAPSNKRKIKISPIDLALLPAQIFVVATAKLALMAWKSSKNGANQTEKTEEEDEL